MRVVCLQLPRHFMRAHQWKCNWLIEWTELGRAGARRLLCHPLSPVSVCVCVWCACVFASVGAYMFCMHVETWGWCQEPSLASLPFCSLTRSPSKLRAWWHGSSYWPVCSRDPLSLPSEARIVGGLPHPLGMHVGSGGLNLGPHACAAGTLAAEPSPQSPLRSMSVLPFQSFSFSSTFG